MALQNSFYHWSTHEQENHIYTIQTSILKICLFKITTPTGNALNMLNNSFFIFTSPHPFSAAVALTGAFLKALPHS